MSRVNLSQRPTIMHLTKVQGKHGSGLVWTDGILPYSKTLRASFKWPNAPHTIFQPISFQKQFQLQMTSDLNQDLRKQRPFNQSLKFTALCAYWQKIDSVHLIRWPSQSIRMTCEFLTRRAAGRALGRAGTCSGIGSSRSFSAVPFVTTAF